MTTDRRLLTAGVAASAGIGAAAVGLLALGFGNAGGVVAFVHQCFVVGLPFALVLGTRTLRSLRAVAAIAFALSMAISALSAQVLIMFTLADPLYLLTAATLYGIALALVADAGLGGASKPEPAAPQGGVDDDTRAWRDTRELAIPRVDDGTVTPSPPKLDTTERDSSGRFAPASRQGEADR
jgi:hypothetical protein